MRVPTSPPGAGWPGTARGPASTGYHAGFRGVDAPAAGVPPRADFLAALLRSLGDPPASPGVGEGPGDPALPILGSFDLQHFPGVHMEAPEALSPRELEAGGAIRGASFPVDPEIPDVDGEAPPDAPRVTAARGEAARGPARAPDRAPTGFQIREKEGRVDLPAEGGGPGLLVRDVSAEPESYPPVDPTIEGGTETVTSGQEPARVEGRERTVELDPRRLEGVHPELVTRLERVAERMRAEFGHVVEVVEGVRPQVRQDELFARGRTAPGPTVTWTRNSAHTRGAAVDVRIDGGWDDVEAFQRLQLVAREEGLRTLGMKDPGHLELPRGATPDEWVGSGVGTRHEETPLPRGGTDGAGPGPRRVARGVARPAAVATVAKVARPGTPSVQPRAADAGKRIPGAPDPALPFEVETAERVTYSFPESRATALRDPGESLTAEVDSGLPRTHPGMESHGGPPAPGAVVPRPVAPSSGPTEAGRVHSLLRAEQVRILQEASVPRPPMRLELSDVDGRGTDLLLQLRGREVEAVIGVQDPVEARSLQLRLGELKNSLSGRGLDAERLGVRWTSAETPAQREPSWGEGAWPEEGHGGFSPRDEAPGREGKGQHRRNGSGRDFAPFHLPEEVR